MLPIFYINLDARPDRRDFIEAQLAALGLAGERFAAATPASLTEAERARHRPAHMTLVEWACNVSHIRLWQQIAARRLPAAVVLEDDVTLSRTLPAFLAAIEAGGPGCDLIRLETLGLPVHTLPPDRWPIPEVALRRAVHHDAGAAAYLVTAAAAARLAISPALSRRLVDGVLFNPFQQPGSGLSVRYCDPGLAIQLSWAGAGDTVASSDLVGERAHRKARAPLRRFLGRVAGWATYDAPALAIRLRSGVLQHPPTPIPFRPD